MRSKANFGATAHRFQTPLQAVLADQPEELRTRRYDMVISDLKMPGLDGLQLLEQIAKERLDVLSVIKLIDGAWRIRHSRYAIVDSQDHNTALTGLNAAVNESYND